jgi:hypothetical protein
MTMPTRLALLTAAFSLGLPSIAAAQLSQSDARREAIRTALEAQAVLPERAPAFPDAQLLRAPPAKPSWTPRKSRERTESSKPDAPPGLARERARLAAIGAHRADELIRQETRSIERRREAMEARGAAEGASMASERASFGQARASVARSHAGKPGIGTGRSIVSEGRASSSGVGVISPDRR